MGVTRYNVFKGKTVQEDEKIRGTHRWLTLLADRNVSYVVYKNVTSTWTVVPPWSVFEAKYLTKRQRQHREELGVLLIWMRSLENHMFVNRFNCCIVILSSTQGVPVDRRFSK